MRETNLHCPKCHRLLLEKEAGDFFCFKCKESYTYGSLVCPACMTPKVQLLNEMVCMNPDCPSRPYKNIGLCGRGKPGCSKFSECNHELQEVVCRKDNLIRYYSNPRNNCFIIAYRGRAVISGGELLELLSFVKGRNLNFVPI